MIRWGERYGRAGMRCYKRISDSHDFRGIFENDDLMAFSSTFNRTSQSTESSSNNNDFQACGLANKGISFWSRHFLKWIGMNFLRWELWRDFVVGGDRGGCWRNCR